MFYVHGRILEQQGRAALSPDFGRYEYDASVKLAPRLRGRVLSIFDEGDRFDPACGPTFTAAPALTDAHEIALKTGRDHGLLFQPYPEWLAPAVAWSRRASVTGEFAA